ncbi:MAG: lipoate--protein ligase family protein [Sulfolobales archaeon]
MDVVVDYFDDPLKNVAFEEALFDLSREVYRETIARIWLNPRSVVIGYSLDWCEEVYCEEAVKTNTPIMRRFTGGGAVYHDLGNINISVARYSGNFFVDLETIFSEATSLISEVVKELGLEPRIENLNDVVVRGYKVSGSSAGIRRGGYFYHSTLLVSADINLLKRIIKPRIDRVLRGEVTFSKYNPGNISMFIDVSVKEVMEVILGVLEKRFGYISKRRFNNIESEYGERLYRERYLDKFLFKGSVVA